MEVRVGWHNAKIKIDDYPVTFDDSYHIAFHIKPSVNILNIFENRPTPSPVFIVFDVF